MVAKTCSDDELVSSDDEGDKRNFVALIVRTSADTEVVTDNTPEQAESSDSDEETTEDQLANNFKEQMQY